MRVLQLCVCALGGWFPSKFVLDILGHLSFSMNFRIIFTIGVLKSAGIDKDLYIVFGRITLGPGGMA